MNHPHDPTKILEEFQQKIAAFEPEIMAAASGKVLKVGDGVAKIVGLNEVKAFELLDLDGVPALAANLERTEVGAIILGEAAAVKEGATATATGQVLSVPVGEAMIGRVINPLGEPLDGKPKPATTKFYPVERVAPGVVTREPVSVPLSTGVKIIDALIPIGRGQRELVIGDRGTGKTALALDTIINQKGEDVICIYVAIGQKEAKVARLTKELAERGAMDYTVIVNASASDPAAMLFLAPFAGVALAEYFMDQGKDVLIIYDDLSKHAVSYREVSLLLRRPPGREAYPGDVFYLHSRLLERACRRNKEHGGGSITALPIIETQAGDISAYIPTNVISITDGQIFLESDLFYQGVRPAVNAGLSVSRVGSAAQTKAMKKVAGKLKLSLAQYRELAAFAQFGSDLDEGTRRELARGARLTEILKQGQYAPVPIAKQVIIFYAAGQGFLDEVPVEKVKEYEAGLLKFIELNQPEILTAITTEKQLTSEIEEKLKQVIKDYGTL